MKTHAALWLAFAIALAVAYKCAGRDDAKPAELSPEQLIESSPTGAGIEPRPGYFRKATP